MNGLLFASSRRQTVTCLFWDNRLCTSQDSRVPRTADQWKSFIFIDKTHWGYYSWPKYVPHDVFVVVDA